MKKQFSYLDNPDKHFNSVITINEHMQPSDLDSYIGNVASEF